MDIYQSLKNLYKGRIGRKFYFFGILFFLLAFVLTAIIVFSIFTDYYEELTTLGVVIFLLSYVLYFIFLTSLHVRRFHDKGDSGWYILFLLVPLVNIVIAITLLFEKGNSGMNKYGNDPLESKKDFFDTIFNKTSNSQLDSINDFEKVNIYGYCYKCAAPLGPNSKFCSKCGNQINK